MVQRTFLLVGMVLASVTASGCIFEDDYYSYCDETRCYECDAWGCESWQPARRVGDPCDQNSQCEVGCACVAGVCAETGFCSGDNQCAEAFECNSSRRTCELPDPLCVGDWDCPTGLFCSPQGECVSTGCESSFDCIEGCYCDETIGRCVETNSCQDNVECEAGLSCDLERNTCAPAPEPQCQAPVSCDGIPPACPLGATPAIVDGCYSGACIDNASCPDGNPCESNTEGQCLGDDRCQAVYSGRNCIDPNGNACDAMAAACSCESYRFASCETLF